MANLLTVTVRSREGVEFEGQARSVSAVNTKGPFDILPDHAHFVSTIKQRVGVIKEGGGKAEFTLEEGLIHVWEGKVDVYLGLI